MTVRSKRILHADLDAFYASVEQRDDPRLSGRPMAVGAGIVLAASYEARRFGVRAPMPLREARGLCPDLLVVEPRMDAYSEASRAVFAVFEDVSPEVEPLSIDEAFIDVSGLGRLRGESNRQRLDESLAERLRADVLDRVGLPLSVGGGSTKFLAKVASAVAKPDGRLIVADGDELAFLHPLPVGRLWGVGPKTEAALSAVGIRTVAEVAALEPELLQATVGRAAGTHLHALANNRDPRAVRVGRRRSSIGSQRSFPAGTVDRAEAGTLLLDLVDRVTRRLRAGARIGRTVVLRLRFADYGAATRSRTLVQATNVTDEVLVAAVDLLDSAWPLVGERGLTKIGVTIAGLGDDDAVQLALPFGKQDRRGLDAAIDDIRDRFGVETVTRAPLVGRPSVDMPLLPD